MLLTVAPDKGSIRHDLFSLRMGLARGCSDWKRAEWLEGMPDASAFVPVWDALRAAQAMSTESLYYHYDSHWTFRGAEVFARELVDADLPGAWDHRAVVESDVHVAKADIARNLGWLRVEPRPSLISVRAA